jgi:hypothetical protein
VTRRRAAAVVIALAVAVGALWIALRPRGTEKSEPAPARAADAPSIDEPAVAPPTPAPAARDRVEAPRSRRRAAPTDDAPPSEEKRLVFRFHGRARFEDGRPAVGAKVRVFDVPEETEGSTQIGDEAVIGADGRFEVGALDEDRRAVVYGVLPGFAYAGVYESASTDIVLTFVKGGVVTGTVYDADGRPMPDVSVRLVRCDERGLIATAPTGQVWARPEVAAFHTQATRADGAGRFRLQGASLAAGSRHSVAVVDVPDGGSWRSDVATFETSGVELVRDVRVGVNPLDRVDPLGRVEGIVTDPDDRPVEGADVVYGVLEGGKESERGGVKTDTAGRFEVRLPRDFALAGRRVELRVAHVRHWTWRGAPQTPGEIVRVRLTPWDREPAPGRVLGTAVDSSDRPLSGELVLTVEDEFLRVRSACVLADERGAFTLEGLWHGTWRISLDGCPPVEAAIRDGDEIRVRLRATHDAAELGANERSTRASEVLHARVAELKSRKVELAESGRTKDELDEQLEAAIEELQRAEAMRRKDRIRRDVVVTGVPRDGAYVVGALCEGRIWRVVAKDGVARFSSLSTETWTITIERFGVAMPLLDVAVEEGEGPQTVEVVVPR